MSEAYEVLKKYAKMMADLDYPVGSTAKIVIQTSGGIFATRDGADFSQLAHEDVQKLEMERLPLPKADMRAMVYSSTPYCSRCLREAKPFRASLDDMAQIIGPEVYIVDGRSKNKDKAIGKSFKKALKNSVGCFVLTGIGSKGNGHGYTLTMGRTPYEAVVAMTVLEKSAEVMFMAEKLGGAKPLPRSEAIMMRAVYKKKYSKAEEEIKAQEVEQ